MNSVIMFPFTFRVTNIAMIIYLEKIIESADSTEIVIFCL